METTARRSHGTNFAAAFALLALCLLAPAAARAQWTTSGTNTTTTNNVGVGTSAPETSLHVSTSSTAAGRGITNEQTSADGNSSVFTFKKSRGGAAVQNTDNIGNVWAAASDGASFIAPARMRFSVDGAVSANNVPVSIQFWTGNAGSGVERMRISSGGNVGVGTPAPVTRLHLGSEIADDANRAYDPNALMVIHQTPTATATLNDPKPVFYLGRQGTSSQAYGAMATFSLSRYENAGASGVGSRTRLDLALTHDSFNDATVMTMLSNGNVGFGTAAPAHRLDVSGNVNASGLCLGGDCKTAWSQITGGGSSQWTTSGTAVYYNDGNVGIGTASPVSRLSVGGQADNLLQVVSTGSGATDTVASFASAVGNILTVRGNGNVGFGTGSPGAQLEVRRDQASGTELRVTNANAAGLAGVYLNGGFAQSAGGFLQWNNTAGNNNLFVATGGGSPLHLGTNNTVRMTVMPTSGNVGIGTTAPASKLFVGGGTAAVATLPGLNVALGGDSYVSASNGTISTFLGADNSTYGIVGTLSNHPLGLRANNAVAVTVMPSGNVGVGTAAPAQKLDVIGNVNASGLCLAGDCKTAWSQVGGGTSSQWTTSGANIHFDSGNVGVGTSAPANKLHVTGGARVDGAGRVYLGATAANGARGLELVEESATTFSIRHHDPNVAWRNLSLNPYAGNVGVNTVNPIAPLTVGDASSLNSDGFIVLGKRTSVGTRQMRMGYDANFNFVIGDYGSNNAAGPWSGQFVINWLAPSNSLHINSAGKVGIGTASPAEALDVVGNIRATGSVSATYQDVAEWVPSTQRLAPGTVVVLDAGRNNHVVASAAAYDTKVAGVVSAQPGLILGVGGDDKLQVATTGRVKVKVDASRGAIKVGDLLVTSGVEGVAMKSVAVDLGGVSFHRPGTIIGKALEPLEKGTGEILVLLSLQ